MALVIVVSLEVVVKEEQDELEEPCLEVCLLAVLLICPCALFVLEPKLRPRKFRVQVVVDVQICVFCPNWLLLLLIFLFLFCFTTNHNFVFVLFWIGLGTKQLTS